MVAVVLVGALLGDNLTSEGHVTSHPDSLRAYDLQFERFPQQEGFDELIIVRSETSLADDEPFRSKLTEFAAALEETRATEGMRTVVASTDRASCHRTATRC